MKALSALFMVAATVLFVLSLSTNNLLLAFINIILFAVNLIIFTQLHEAAE